jgi:hypothetical protein
LNTAEPAEARRLARRLAVRWDELAMDILERGTLTQEEQRLLFRKGLEYELAHATRHVTAPGSAAEPHRSTSKILSAAYEIIRGVAPDCASVGPDQINAVIGDSWSADERDLLVKTLKLYVTPRMVGHGTAAVALKAIDAPVNDSTIAEARSHLLRGWIEAQHRAALLDHPLLAATGDPAHYLLDDAIVREARASAPAGVAASPCSRVSVEPVNNGFFARVSAVRFSEQLEALHDRMFDQNSWQPDNGKTRLALEAFAWITGDKLMSDYSPTDIDHFVEVLQKVPKTFEWGRIRQSGGMAEPFDASKFAKKPPVEMRRSARTINSYLSKLQAASDILKKTAWLPRGGHGNIMMFSDGWMTVDIDPANPKRMPFTPEHLKAMYGLPLWQGSGGAGARLKSAPLPVIYQDAAYWVPLFGTYAGLAREEACGLEIVDFNFDCPIPYFLVQANMTRSKDGKTKAGLKRKSRYRAMPIHPEMLRLGLREYVEAIETSGYPMLFPELYAPEAKAGKEDAKAPAKGGRRFYAIGWRFIMDATHAIAPLPETEDGKKADFHSQRTYNNSVLASPEISETLIADHMGHARKGTGARNYNRRALTLGQETELRERLEVVVREVPVVTSHVPKAPTLELLHIAKRSRVGSAPGRNAISRFCA